MATISLSVARDRDIAGKRRRTIGQYTGPAVYAAGGEVIAPGAVGMGVIEFVAFELATDGTTWYGITYDYANNKAIWAVLSTGVQVAGGVNLAAFVARFEAVGY